jgi:hypothetical protein
MQRTSESDAIEQRVLTFTSVHAGVAMKHLTPMTQLARDLDVTGEDASDFFNAFAKEFRVNLDELNMHWDLHFHPEPGLLLNASFAVAGCVTLAIGILALFRFGGRMWSYDWFSPYETYRTPTWIASGIVSLIIWTVTWYRNRATEPVTIADLIDAAEAGQWVKRYRPRT